MFEARSKRKHRKRGAGHFVKLVRVAVGLAMLAVVTALFTFLSASVADRLGWVSRIQIVPLALAGAGAALAFWVAVTLLFGRVYCSWVCPMGVVQDIFSRLMRLTRHRRLKHPYRWSSPKNRFRYVVLAAVVAAAVCGFPFLLTLLDPYSIYGRIASEMLLPARQWLASEPVFAGSLVAFAIALVTLAAIAMVAMFRGRLFCNTLCPVGSGLSLLSRYSLLHFDIDTDLCVNCGLCSRNCKAECIDLSNHVVDASRCVACFNCVDTCRDNAIKYTFRRKRLSLPMLQQVGGSATVSQSVKTETGKLPVAESSRFRVDRRRFLETGLIVAAAPALTVVASGKRRIAAISGRHEPLHSLRAVAPPGRRTMKEFLERCTGCGLCVARCPANVLKPSVNELGWVNILHPIMDYERSYCRYNCTRCSEVCPSGALQSLTEDEKHLFVVGNARVDAGNCIGCGLCASRCPRKAIKMIVRTKDMGSGSLMVAKVDLSLCIGCGACQYICPATPQKAIGVDGIS